MYWKLIYLFIYSLGKLYRRYAKIKNKISMKKRYRLQRLASAFRRNCDQTTSDIGA
jgi:hypothetical protein